MRFHDADGLEAPSALEDGVVSGGVPGAVVVVELSEPSGTSSLFCSVESVPFPPLVDDVGAAVVDVSPAVVVFRLAVGVDVEVPADEVSNVRVSVTTVVSAEGGAGVSRIVVELPIWPASSGASGVPSMKTPTPIPISTNTKTTSAINRRFLRRDIDLLPAA